MNGRPVTTAELITRARALADQGSRKILGIVGSPGSGKGTVADAIRAALPTVSVVVPMDGFHLAQSELARLDRAERKGAPDTYDAAGFVALLRRLREPDDQVVYAPEFHREVEESFAGAIPVRPDVPLVIVEGNYLLLEDGPWAAVRVLLDEAWYLDPDDKVRVARLVARHMQFGRTDQEARRWAECSDGPNAEAVRASRHRADLIVNGDPE